MMTNRRASTDPIAKGAASSRSGARVAFALNAALAWFGFVLVCLLSAADQYTTTVAPAPHEFGWKQASGVAGVFSRLLDTLSYFTVWSNVVVAISCTLVALASGKRGASADWAGPHALDSSAAPTASREVHGVAATSRWRRIVRLDALIMITVTAIVYALLLAPASHPTGWDLFTNPLQHIAVPLVTIVVWLVWGPRGEVDRRAVAGCFALPGLWIVYTLIRGAIIGAYPYPFLNVDAHGYVSVTITLVVILLFGLLWALVYWAIDRRLTQRARR